jgi:hypothetical protein
LAALTGMHALAGTYIAVGEPDEGVIVLPIDELPLLPLRRDAPPEATFAEPSPPTAHDDGPAVARICLCGCGAAVRNRFLPDTMPS